VNEQGVNGGKQVPQPHVGLCHPEVKQ